MAVTELLATADGACTRPKTMDATVFRWQGLPTATSLKPAVSIDAAARLRRLDLPVAYPQRVAQSIAGPGFHAEAVPRTNFLYVNVSTRKQHPGRERRLGYHRIDEICASMPNHGCHPVRLQQKRQPSLRRQCRGRPTCAFRPPLNPAHSGAPGTPAAVPCGPVWQNGCR